MGCHHMHTTVIPLDVQNVRWHLNWRVGRNQFFLNVKQTVGKDDTLLNNFIREMGQLGYTTCLLFLLCQPSSAQANLQGERQQGMEVHCPHLPTVGLNNVLLSFWLPLQIAHIIPIVASDVINTKRLALSIK